jgi:predicted  nucleic acid-binding Zn-ribbon protein
MPEQKDSVNKGDRNKIYFLIVVIAALLGTNAYLFFKDKHESEKFVTVSTEKDRLKLEVEKIEVELDRVNSGNMALNSKLLNDQTLARNKIAELKRALENGTLTQGDLDKAQTQVKELHEFVRNFSDETVRLNKENVFLKSERDSLKKSVSTVKDQASRLVEKNAELDAKVKTGAALKAFDVKTTAFKVKASGKNIEVNRASSAKKLTIHFNIASNPLAAKDYHKIYLRVFDPSGNLIANEDDMFVTDGQEMQYSDMITVSYNDDNTAYDIHWVNPVAFIKGTYSIILYSDGFTMGKSSITLK